MESSFLEAHYYEGGLRHRHFSLKGTRPDWAPPSDVVGFSDEFALAADTAAVEIRRLSQNQRRLTWVGVYHPSVDARLGDRRNHAGMGIWLDQLSVADARSLVHGLDVLAKKLAISVDPDGVATHATEFLKNFVPKYLVALKALPDLPGLAFAPGRLIATRLTHIQTDQLLGECRLIGDEVLAALYSEPEPQDASRELICVSRDALPPSEAARFHEVSDGEDAASKIIRALPAALTNLTAKLEKTSAEVERAVRERDAAQARSSEYDVLQARLGEFEGDPLITVLSAVREVSDKLDNLNVRGEVPRPLIPSRYAPATQQIVRRPRHRILEDEQQPQQLDWFVIALLGVAIVVVLTMAYFIVDRFAGALL